VGANGALAFLLGFYSTVRLAFGLASACVFI
jgi:hypothetical protein